MLVVTNACCNLMNYYTARALREVCRVHFNGIAFDWIKAAGLTQNVANRYFITEEAEGIRPSRTPRPGSFEKLVQVVPDEAKEMLLAAYFLDAMPPSSLDHLKIESKYLKEGRATALGYSVAIPKKAARFLAKLRRWAETRKETREMLKLLEDYG